jgi:hypothetical protein
MERQKLFRACTCAATPFVRKVSFFYMFKIILISQLIPAINVLCVILVLLNRILRYIQGVPGGKDLTSGECSLGQTIPI